MELRQLKYFLAVAEEASFTKAARRLFVAQSTLSEQIQTLERTLGATLFERDSRHVRLTAQGEHLVEPARRLLADAEAAKSAVALAGRSESNERLRLGMVCHPAPLAVRQLVEELNRTLPTIQVQLLQMSLTGYAAALRDGTVDAVVVAPRQDAYFDCTVLVAGDLLAAMQWNHPLAKADVVTVGDVLDAPAPRPHPEMPRFVRDFWWMTKIRNGIEPRYVGDEVATCTDMSGAVLYAGAVMLIPRCLAEVMEPNGLVVYRELIEPAPCDLVVAARHGDDRPLIATVKLCAEAVRESAQSLTPAMFEEAER